MFLSARLQAIAQTLCPERCPRCNDESPRGFCGRCSDEFERIAYACPACGLPGPSHTCPARSPCWKLDAVRAPFVYAPPLAVFVQRLKFARQHRLGRALGILLAREIAQAALCCGAPECEAPDCEAPGCEALRCDALVAVPLHRRRLRERTFNQADEIARPLARMLGIPLKTAGIRRELHTPAQTGLARAERLANLERGFSVRSRLDGLRIAIVDDVITTGATVNALAGALRTAGAIRVEAWGVARTVGPAGGDAQAGWKM
jgi:ComF family protein